MILQEIFDKVATHLATQGKKSLGPMGGCLYRSPDGCMCAVGCLITDEAYQESMEGWCVSEVGFRNAIEQSGIEYTVENLRLLSSLQSIHDVNEVAEWKTKLFRLAETFQPGLSTTVLDKLEWPNE